MWYFIKQNLGLFQVSSHKGKDKLSMHNIANKQRAPDANGKIISLD
jgi:hypothetical protein